ncbi:MAG: 4-(cytidine 5'-diphospho)-2-C-methyl-D-erythritol kinase [Cyclobacteriaceae bacterium]|nr:4-(cytidine 5'-diphospho)-2-C-methyl-D-erythritol kinase [Cyclobacteriaceae bacterium]
MVTFPNAKINLGLNIIRKRNDGYHDLETVFYPVPWCDILEIVPSDEVTLHTTGLPVPGDVSSNLVIKAYELLRKDFELGPVAIHLHKIIPMGAGLGGGSSDAAFALKMLSEMFDLFLDTSLLNNYAGMLGSDCAFFVENEVAFAHGRGEIIEPFQLSLKGLYIEIVQPDIAVSTREAYSMVKPGQPGLNVKEVLKTADFDHWRNYLVNDFEMSVFSRYPQIEQIKKGFYEFGALYASMSGSGSAVFGIFKDKPILTNRFPETYKVWQGVLE